MLSGTTHTHREAPQSSQQGFVQSLNSDIRYLTLFLNTFAFKLQFCCKLFCLCRWQIGHSPSIWSWHCRYFWLESSVKGKRKRNLTLLSVIVFLVLLYVSLLNSFFSDFGSMCQVSISMGLKSVLSPSCSFLVIIQKQRDPNRERGGRKREGEAL